MQGPHVWLSGLVLVSLLGTTRAAPMTLGLDGDDTAGGTRGLTPISRRVV